MIIRTAPNPLFAPRCPARIALPAQHGYRSSQSALGDVVFAGPIGQSRQDYILNQLLWIEGASADFVEQVRQTLKQRMPVAMLSDLRKDGYSLILRDLVTGGDKDLRKACVDLLHGDFDFASGFHMPESKTILVSEFIIKKPTSQQITDFQAQNPTYAQQREKLVNREAYPQVKEKSLYWQNALFHEIGHRVSHFLGHSAASRILPNLIPDAGQRLQAVQRKGTLNYRGITESPEFLEAYQADFEAMPKSVINGHLAYFTSVPAVGARQEAFAEAFDILVRGDESTVNAGPFKQHFPRTLKATYGLIRSHYRSFEPHPTMRAAVA